MKTFVNKEPPIVAERELRSMRTRQIFSWQGRLSALEVGPTDGARERLALLDNLVHFSGHGVSVGMLVEKDKEPFTDAVDFYRAANTCGAAAQALGTTVEHVRPKAVPLEMVGSGIST